MGTYFKKYVSDDVYIIYDNTFLTPFLFNPFNHGAHVVVDSCSKYFSNTQCISGSICMKTVNDPLTQLIMKNVDYMGIHIPDIYCQMIIDSISTLKDRLMVSHDRTAKYLSTLKQNQKATIVNHASLNNPIYNENVSLLYPVINIFIKTDIYLPTVMSNSMEQKNEMKQNKTNER